MTVNECSLMLASGSLHCTLPALSELLSRYSTSTATSASTSNSSGSSSSSTFDSGLLPFDKPNAVSTSATERQHHYGSNQLSMGHCDDHNKLTKRSVIGDQDVDLDEETVDYRYNSNLGSSKWSAQMLFDSSAILNASPSRTGTTRDHHHHQSLTDPVLMQKLLQLAGGLVKVENGSKAMPDSTGTGASNNLYRSNSNVYSTDKAPIEYALNRVQRNDSIEPNHTQSTLQSELKSTSEQVKKHLAVTQQLHVQLQQSSTEIEELRLERKQLLKRLQSIEDEHKQHCKLLQNSNNDRLQQAQQKLQVSETKSEKLLSQLAGAQQKMKEIEMRHVQQTESVRIDLQQARDQSELLLQQIQSKESEMKELQNEQRRLQQLLQSRLKAIAQAEDKALKSESRANQAEEQLKLFDELKSDRDLLQSQLTTSRDQFNKANRQITELSASVKRLLDERNQALLHLQQIQSILIQLPAAAAAAANKSGIHSGEKQGSGSGGTWNTEQSQMINSLDSPDSKQANKMMENHYSTENPTNSLDMDRLLLQILNGSSLGDVEPDTHNEFACCRPDENQLNGSIDSISESYQNLDLNALSIKKHKKSGGKKEGKRGLSKFGLSDKKLKFNFL